MKLLLNSPFCKKFTPSVVNPVKPVTPEPSQSEKLQTELNLESLKEAQIYGLPIIPFPYSEQRRLITEAQPEMMRIRKQAFSSATRKLDFESFEMSSNESSNSEEDEFEMRRNQTPLLVKALATPNINRKIANGKKAEHFDKKHCGSCTCHLMLSRREMLSGLRKSDDLSTYSLKLREEAMAKLWNNNQSQTNGGADYVKMSAKLV